MLAISTVANSIEANSSIVLGFELLFYGTEVWLVLLLQKIDTFLDDLFSFRFRETFEGEHAKK